MSDITRGDRVRYTVMYNDGLGFGLAHIEHRPEYGRVTSLWPPDAPAMCRIAVEDPKPGRAKYVTRKLRDVEQAPVPRLSEAEQARRAAAVRRFLDEQLSCDDMSLTEIAAEVTAIALRQS